ncbi:MAG: hypothetical protein LJE91_03630 [Gammaproteobacteria bacterium]|nr:hypothetical protein [Gammaproteobacteria bacterium]
MPIKAALAVCAAFEHIADCTFAAYLEEYYARGWRYACLLGYPSIPVFWSDVS